MDNKTLKLVVSFLLKPDHLFRSSALFYYILSFLWQVFILVWDGRDTSVELSLLSPW